MLQIRIERILSTFETQYKKIFLTMPYTFPIIDQDNFLKPIKGNQPASYSSSKLISCCEYLEKTNRSTEHNSTNNNEQQ